MKIRSTAACLIITSLSAANSNLLAAEFAKPETGEHLPGGETSHLKRINRDSFSHPSANMPFDKELDFRIGNGFFKRLWVTAPASTQAADGLGPLYNARACQRCHIGDGRGHPPDITNPSDNAVSMFLRLSVPPSTPEQKQALESGRLSVIPDPVYGTQLQDFAIPGVPAEGQMKIRYTLRTVQLSDGEIVELREPHYRIEKPGYGPLSADLMISPRVAPPMIGLGLLERIPETAIRAQADPHDQDGDGVSGRPQEVWSAALDQLALGRFGWKAGNATLDDQNQGAFIGDMGLSVPMHPDGHGECTNSQRACIEAPDGNSPQYDNLEVPKQITDLVLSYTRNLAVPARRNAGDPEVLQGKRLFHEAGCASCHTPRFQTDDGGIEPHLRQQIIWPYTDLLLHDMGEGLADNRPEGRANGREWRTPPLWGIGKTEVVSGHSTFLHDGRARNLLEAVIWHGGEAAQARDRVIRMSKAERKLLLRFLKSL